MADRDWQAWASQGWARVRERAASAKTRLQGWRQARPFTFWSVALVGLPLVSVVSLVFGLLFAVWIGVFGSIPTRDKIKNVETPEASYLLDRKGDYIARYYDTNRELVDDDEIPETMLQALLSTEDSRFFEHSGVDWEATGRAVWYSGLRGQEEQGGGSTLSQQLAKNHFPREGRGKFRLLISKIKEAFTAQRFEKEYSKAELVTLYLNTVPFGENIYGVKLAAQRFFDVDPLALKTEEVAVLVGMLKANTSYHPVWHPEAALERRNVVLIRMAEQGYLDTVLRDSLVGLPLNVKEAKDRDRVEAGYFVDRVKTEIEGILKELKDDRGRPYGIGRSGLRITSTLDLELQRHAEKSLKTHLDDLQPSFREQWRREDPEGFAEQLDKAILESPRFKEMLAAGKSEEEALAGFGESRKMTYAESSAYGARKMKSSYRDSLRAELLRLRASFVVADHHTGEVLAYVGGGDHFAVQYNSAAAKRQVGSTFKPVVYAQAIELGRQPCDYLANKKISYPSGKEEDYTPENSDGRYGGYYSMTGALVKSVNTIAVAMADSISTKRVVEMAKKLGLEGVPDDLAAALGTASLSVEEMIRAYSAFAQNGRLPTYRMVARIETREGKVIYEAPTTMASKFAMTPTTATSMDYMLRQVSERGTGSDLALRFGVESEVAGKTGTTQDQADGWFVGYTRDLVFGAWMGAAYPNIRWKSLSSGQGSKTALPIVARFLREYERERGVTELPELSEDDEFRFRCSDRRWSMYTYDPYYELEEGDYVPGEMLPDGTMVPLPDEGTVVPPAEGEAPSPAEDMDRETRSRDDAERIREREAANERVREKERAEQQEDAERDVNSGDDEKKRRGGLRGIFKRRPE